ncbi:DNA-processing protein DprA [Paenalcaligenes niemegkensis]|uniref:DNA-processing protein DprA n=1 Tax=Paenalcaligenes niemegkensis TaxID=2895469 RepID=UPI001EE815F3|nr:DNA-processing protein DprA [Paenalcaligenes niemegkensis]MCQ9617627.1 DNA-processing protein DprA [Paenalcaligenes niemegkensis]
MSNLLNETELASWLRLSLEPELGPAQARLLLAHFGLPQDIYSQSVSALAKFLPHNLAAQLKAGPSDALTAQIERSIDWAALEGNAILSLADESYPQALLDSHDPPLLLYAKGNIKLLNTPGLAMVGARSSTAAGNENAFAFAQHLSAQGWTIISGLATGIDAAAHKGSLAANNPQASTIAVLGTGIDIVYPAANRELAHSIAGQGLLISEFPLGSKALHFHFPKRNRIVAGLANGVLVVEAALKSGSLITARLASEMGREVFAIPGSIHSPLSKGCHQLIRQGAKLVESADDINDELKNVVLTAKTLLPAKDTPLSAEMPSLAPHQQRVLDALGYDAISPDLLQQRTQLDIASLASAIVELELAGLIEQLSTGYYQRLTRQ